MFIPWIKAVPVSDILGLGEPGERQRARPGPGSVSPEAVTLCAGAMLALTREAIGVCHRCRAGLRQHGADAGSRLYCGCNDQVAN